jgi:hypothetical protein
MFLFGDKTDTSLAIVGKETVNKSSKNMRIKHPTKVVNLMLVLSSSEFLQPIP